MDGNPRRCLAPSVSPSALIVLLMTFAFMISAATDGNRALAQSKPVGNSGTQAGGKLVIDGKSTELNMRTQENGRFVCQPQKG